MAQYVAERFPSFLKESKDWREGRLEEALTSGSPSLRLAVDGLNGV